MNADYTGDDDQADLDYGGDYYQDGNGEESMLEADVSTAEGEEGSGGKDWVEDPLENASGVASKRDGGGCCLTCGKTYSLLRNAKRHYQEVHLSTNQVFKCKFCGKVFNRKRYRDEHLSKKHGVKMKDLKKVHTVKPKVEDEE